MPKLAIYDQNGNRKYRSTGTLNKSKARAYVLKKYRDGTLTKGYFRSSGFLLDQNNFHIRKQGNIGPKHYLHLVPSDLNTFMDVARQIMNL